MYIHRCRVWGAEGLEPPPPPPLLLNLIAVTILANFETRDVTKKSTFMHIKFILFINYLYS